MGFPIPKRKAGAITRSVVDEARAKLDRDNKLCWHWPSRRLEAEVIRDSLLAVSGQLDAKLFDRRFIGLDFDTENFGPFAAVDRALRRLQRVIAAIARRADDRSGYGDEAQRVGKHRPSRRCD